MIVYLARDIPAFVMYYVYGKSRSSLLIESTDSMIIQFYNPGCAKDRYYKILRHISGFLNVNSPPRVVYNTVCIELDTFPKAGHTLDNIFQARCC